MARKHHKFVVEIEAPTGFVTPTGSIVEAITLVQTDLEPNFIAQSTIGTMATQIETGGPLFQVLLMKLPAGHMAYAVELSHLIGDGNTYYQLLHVLNCAMNGKPMPKLKWSSAPESVALPAEYSPQDKALHMEGWIPAYVERIKKWEPGTEQARRGHLQLINMEAVATLKSEYKAHCDARNVPFISTNDLITAGLAELCDPGSLLLMFANLRGRIPEAQADLAGNYERGVIMPSSESIDPTFIRSVTKHWLYYGTEGRPKLSTDDGDPNPKHAIDSSNFVVVTNWASLTHLIEPPATRVVCHCPTTAFVTGLAGIDMAVVFKADNKGTLALLTNHLVGARGTEIAPRVGASKIFKRLVSAQPPAPGQAPRVKLDVVRASHIQFSTSALLLGVGVAAAALGVVLASRRVV